MVLQLNSNEITSLPRSFGNLKSLKHVDLNFNRLQQIPPTFGFLSQLEVLKLGNNNQLVSLPVTLADLKNLVELDLTGNDSMQSPPLSVCQDGVESVLEYLCSAPQTEEDLQEGWELVSPTPTDEAVLFDMSEKDITPYSYLDSFDYGYDNQHMEGQESLELSSSGWISSVLYFPLNAVKSLVWGSSSTTLQ